MLLFKYKMKKHKLISRIFGILLIFIGIIFYLTPIPGTTALIIMGFILFIGPNKTLVFFKKHLSKENFKKLKIKTVFKKLNNL